MADMLCAQSLSGRPFAIPALFRPGVYTRSRSSSHTHPFVRAYVCIYLSQYRT